ncbi:MAG: hypothetical protein KatS3mg061_2617 [Dehalococcoidia bacterium]|nr:MAG: hypothetical protein KatS3mg061_2617 [Dehalococcoidia bacterium]
MPGLALPTELPGVGCELKGGKHETTRADMGIGFGIQLLLWGLTALLWGRWRGELALAHRARPPRRPVRPISLSTSSCSIPIGSG